MADVGHYVGVVGTFPMRALDSSTVDAFVGLVERCDGYPTGCWCMGFHPEGLAKGDDWDATNRKRKLERIATGTAHAALVFDDDVCVGWAQVGPTDERPVSRTGPPTTGRTHHCPIGGSPAASS